MLSIIRVFALPFTPRFDFLFLVLLLKPSFHSTILVSQLANFFHPTCRDFTDYFEFLSPTIYIHELLGQLSLYGTSPRLGSTLADYT